MLKYSPQGMQSAAQTMQRCQAQLRETWQQTRAVRSRLADTRCFEKEQDALRRTERHLQAAEESVYLLKSALEEIVREYAAADARSGEYPVFVHGIFDLLSASYIPLEVQEIGDIAVV